MPTKPQPKPKRKSKRKVMESWPHPGNGQGVGGCIVSSTLVRLECGHVKSYPSSKCPKGFAYCVECEATQK